MARMVKEEEYAAKRNEILDFALGLVYTRGYDQMTIQDILDGLHISKGAFYHYFDSKRALLEALIDRMGRTAEQAVLPIVQDPHLPALQKFRHYFEASARWKSDQKTLIISLLRMWYSDENAFIRQKMTSESLKHTPRLLEPIIRQGVEEGVFNTRFPEQAAGIVAGVTLNLSDTLVNLVLAPSLDRAGLQKAEVILEAYIDAVERIVGAPPGSLRFSEMDDITTWWAAMQPESKAVTR